jgi:hypothetical protein
MAGSPCTSERGILEKRTSGQEMEVNAMEGEINDEAGEMWMWKGSTAVCLTFRTKELPPHVYFHNMKIEVSTFVAAIRQCYKCGKFGQISKFCTMEKQCFSCGEVKMKYLVLQNA